MRQLGLAIVFACLLKMAFAFLPAQESDCLAKKGIWAYCSYHCFSFSLLYNGSRQNAVSRTLADGHGLASKSSLINFDLLNFPHQLQDKQSCQKTEV